MMAVMVFGKRCQEVPGSVKELDPGFIIKSEENI